MPKRSCTDRAKWRLLRGKPAQPLAAHYQLDCDYGTPVLTIYREGEGDTPTYLCEVHAAAEQRAAAVVQPDRHPASDASPGFETTVLMVETDSASDVVEERNSETADDGRIEHLDIAAPPPAAGTTAAETPTPPAGIASAPARAASTPVMSTARAPVEPVAPASRKITTSAPSSAAPKPKILTPKPDLSKPSQRCAAPKITPATAKASVPTPELVAPPAAKVPPPQAAVGISAKVLPPKANSSSKTSARDLAYGNPAKALVDETIWNLHPGDYDAYRTALREGKPAMEAAQAAGGQLAVVYRKIHEYAVRIDALLSASDAPIDVDGPIHAILESEMLQIIGDDAEADAQKDVALARLGEFEEWINRSLKPTATPLKISNLSLAIAQRANWGTTSEPIPNELKSAYRAVYSSLRHAIHAAVPDVREPADRLANLHAAKSELESVRNSTISAPDSGLAASGSVEEEKFAAT